MFPRVPHSVITVISRALFFSLGCMILLLVRCEREDWLSPDYGREELLPDRDDYLNEDYGTQLLANELAGVYAAEIGLVYYDAETRTIPQLYLTRGEKEICVDSLSNGAVYVYFDKFNTAFMPLQLSIKVRCLLEATTDTIYLRGSDGIVRTSNDDGPIGAPLPESDDAELIGKYARKSGAIVLFIDPMLPVPVKASVTGTKM